MKNDLSELIEPIKELVSMRHELKKLIAKDAGPTSLNLSSEKFHGTITTVSFRTYQGVAEDFRAFAAGIKGFKNQDLVAQAIVEFMERYHHLSTPPVSLVLGSELCAVEEKTQSYSKMVKAIREEITKKSATTAPQVRIYDSKLVGAKDFILKVDDGREFSGSIKDKSLTKLKSQLHTVMLEKAKTS